MFARFARMPVSDVTELQSRRKELGLTQTELGTLAGVETSEISRWERFVGEPRNTDRQRYAAALGWSVEQLGAVIYRGMADLAPAAPLAEG